VYYCAEYKLGKGLVLVDFNTAISNLLSIPVLVFLLALLATRLKTEVKLPDALYQGITIFLLVGIGLKGGHALKSTGGHEFTLPAIATFALGIVIPLIAYGLLSLTKKIGQQDRASIAAHYGSTSLVTFSAGLVMLESLKVFVEPYVATLLAIMEVPGIIVGIYLGTRKSDSEGEKSRLTETLREVFLGRTVVLLVGGLLAGFFAPEQSFEKVQPFFVDLQPGILVLFLLQLGAVVGSRLETLKEAGWALPVFGVVMPLIGGTLGATTGILAGMSVGGATMLAVLTASASYIAAPAAIGIAMPKANLGLALSASLGVTFPFNLLVGIPLYLSIAQSIAR
jgi:hypothetical protein